MDTSPRRTPAPGLSPAITVKSPPPATRLSDLTPQQWKSGAAAWLGWLFDGLDLHLYVVVASTVVADLLGTSRTDPAVGEKAAWIQAAFLVGWALGGGFFGVVGDRVGRSKALMLTILTYALFTGVSYFAQTWWQLLIFRFLAALGIGGEWAVGASLLSETWPRSWRPWMAAVLQTAVNIGMILAAVTVSVLKDQPPKTVFLVGVLPALLVLWIRRAVPEPEEWHQAKTQTGEKKPRFSDLFRGEIRKTTWMTLSVCALGLTGHWAFMFWNTQHLRNLPELQSLTEGDRSQIVAQGTSIILGTSIAGNFVAALIARYVGYRRSIGILSLGYFLAMFGTYYQPLTYQQMRPGLALIGMCQGLFCLYTMYLPALFPTLLRTTGAGFCYNIGRIAAAAGTVLFGLSAPVNDYRSALVWAAFLFVPASIIGFFLPEPQDETLADHPVSTTTQHMHQNDSSAEGETPL